MPDCTVMTWNVENLFPVGHLSGAASVDVYQRKLRYLAKTIRDVGPDVIGLQEVGDPTCLADLQAALGGRYPHAAISSRPDIRGIRVAVLSASPLTDVRQLFEFTPEALPRVPTADGKTVATMGRGALQVVVEVSGRRLRVVTAHLKSKLLSYPEGRRFPKDEHERARGAGFALLRRAAEAVALRVHLNTLMADEALPTVLVGDFNDGPSAITTDLLQGPPDTSMQRPDKGDLVRLNNLAGWLPGKHAFSRMFREEPELIDHILVSQDILRGFRQVDSLVDGVRSITEDVESRRNAVRPDHAPLFARFVLP
ncbi:MAG: endonuclease/exonuclease/phosphatase family protein [Dehalococcoidia bacterium]|nr:endonuclease/exonuclease/phosphatase family protein [Dehalococcoidia bacterium]